MTAAGTMVDMVSSRKDEDPLLTLLGDARLWAEVDTRLGEAVVEATDDSAPGARATDPLS